MKGKIIHTLMLALAGSCAGLSGYTPPAIPYAPAAGEPGSTAVPHDAVDIDGWATGIDSVAFGSDVGEEYRDPQAALGSAVPNSPSVLVLGRGGSIVLEFQPGIVDGAGADFAVFENAFRDTFLELAHVEVSSDGTHFVRFPNYSLTPDPVGAFGDVLPEFVDGLAGKYRAGFGTPFDLATLGEAYAAALLGKGGFSEEFRTRLIENFPYLDPAHIRYVRIIDIVGDGSAMDSEGFPIYDPYPTIITAGFDLDAVAVLNQAQAETVSFAEWASGYGVIGGASGDPDLDRWSNYMEYLFASNPKEKASVPRVAVAPSSGGGAYSAVFWRNLSAEVLPQLQLSWDGNSWTAADPADVASITASARQEGQPVGRVEVWIPAAAPALLVRFVATP